MLIIAVCVAYKLKHHPKIPAPPADIEAEPEFEPKTKKPKKIIPLAPDDLVIPEDQPEDRPDDEGSVENENVEIPEPVWTTWPKVRNVNNLGRVLNDIDSHMPAGHQYRDGNKITWAHETTHGINADVRNKHYQPNQRRVNAFYVLNDRAAVITEPPITIAQMADMVPQDLRGPSYQLYLVQQRRDWNNEPLYLMDEWTAYTNGTECGRELNAQGWDFELLQAHNFNVYCLYLAKAIQERCPDYDDKQFKAYLMWNMARVFRLTEGSITSRPARMALVEPEYMTALDLHFGKKKHTCEHPEANFGHWWDDKNKRLVNLTQMGVDNPIMRADAYVERVKTRESARELREFMKKYLGEAFCRKTYGF